MDRCNELDTALMSAATPRSRLVKPLNHSSIKTLGAFTFPDFLDRPDRFPAPPYAAENFVEAEFVYLDTNTWRP